MIYLCDSCDNLAITGGLKWSVDQLSWRDEGVRYATASFSDAMDYVVRVVATHSGMDLRRTTGNANIRSVFQFLDGTNGVLARHELPGRGSGQHEQLTGWWDSAERPNQIILNVTTLHEICHGLGIVHFNSQPSLMNSRLNPRFHDVLDQWTINELQGRYGTPRTVVPVPDCATWLAQLCQGAG